MSQHPWTIARLTLPSSSDPASGVSAAAEGAPIDTPEAAAELLSPVLDHFDREVCLLLALNSKSRLSAVRTVSIGTIEHTFMSPREIYRDALLANAASILVAHNHPSGDPTPSTDDIAITRRLATAGTTMGIELVDHLIIGNPGWVSLAREGVL